MMDRHYVKATRIMTDVTRILNQIENGDPSAADQLLPLVYEELRLLAAQRLANEKPGQTLQATALVHEAYLRLVGNGQDKHWDGRGHFFAAAAEAMRRVLINSARDKKTKKRAGQRVVVAMDEVELASETPVETLLEINDVLEALEKEDKLCADLIKLRFFAGLTLSESARQLELSRRTAYRLWAFARAWLLDKLADGDSETNKFP
jgi:RNA polymerase sigma factor (TIGR02999 family)